MATSLFPLIQPHLNKFVADPTSSQNKEHSFLCRKMERIVNNFNWLLRLVKSSPRNYQRLINQATPDQIRSVIECVDLCSFTKIVKSKKELRSVLRIVSC